MTVNFKLTIGQTYRLQGGSCLVRLSRQEQEKTAGAVDSVIDFIASGQRPSTGLGLKKLQKSFWEVRVTIKLRILFAFEDGLLTFILAGSHDAINRFLGKQ